MNYCEQYCRTIKRMANAGGGALDTNTMLLLPLNGDYKDYSIYNHPVTVTNSVEYDDGYFPGTQALKVPTGSYITWSDIPNNYEDFSFDLFLKVTRARAFSFATFNVFPSTSSTYGGLCNGTGSVGTPMIHYGFTYGTWYHVAATRVGTTVRFFINGNMIGSASSEWNVGGAMSTGIRLAPTYTETQYMYASNVRYTLDVLHTENNGVYTYPVPTDLYTD